MNLDKLREATRAQMPDKRWKHTLGVVDSAVELAKRYGGDPDRAELAALLHDYAKAWAVDRMEAVIREQGLPAELLDHDKELWHSHVGAWAVRAEHGIDDEEVLEASRYHTSGREGMTKLDKIVCLADYIEPGRAYPGVDLIRERARHSLEDALVAAFGSTIGVLIERGKRIFPLTVLARNDLITQMKQNNNGG